MFEGLFQPMHLLAKEQVCLKDYFNPCICWTHFAF